MDEQRQRVRSAPGPGSGAGDSGDPYASGGGVQRQVRDWATIAREAAGECADLSNAEQELRRRAQRSGQ